MTRRIRICLTALVAGLLLPLSAVHAQGYPNKPIRFIVPFSSGSSTDIVARIIGQKLTEAWKQPVVVDNRAGADGIIGTEALAKAPSDGYTIGMGTISTLATNAGLYPKLPYDPAKDFAPVSMTGYTPVILVVHPSVPAANVKELIALAKAKPGQINFGAGSSTVRLAGELFKILAGVNMVHIPYKSNPPAMTDVIAGQVHLMFDTLTTAMPHIRSGAVRALGISSRERSATVPEIPTIAEAGVPGYELTAWWGVVAPAGTSKEVVDKLNGEIVRILNLPDVQESFAKVGGKAISSTPDQFGDFIKTETTRLVKIIKDVGMTVQ